MGKYLVHFILFCIGLFMVCVALGISYTRSCELENQREEMEINIFILPDGSLYIPAEELQQDIIECRFKR